MQPPDEIYSSQRKPEHTGKNALNYHATVRLLHAHPDEISDTEQCKKNRKPNENSVECVGSRCRCVCVCVHAFGVNCNVFVIHWMHGTAAITTTIHCLWK